MQEILYVHFQHYVPEKIYKLKLKIPILVEWHLTEKQYYLGRADPRMYERSVSHPSAAVIALRLSHKVVIPVMEIITPKTKAPFLDRLPIGKGRFFVRFIFESGTSSIH